MSKATIAIDWDGVGSEGFIPDSPHVIITGRKPEDNAEIESAYEGKKVPEIINYPFDDIDEKVSRNVKIGAWKAKQLKKNGISKFYEDTDEQVLIIRELAPDVEVVKVIDGIPQERMNFIVFTFDGTIIPVAEKLEKEGNRVIVGVIDDKKDTLLPDEKSSPEDPDKKKKRMSIGKGIIDAYDANEVLKFMKGIKNKGEWFVLTDSNSNFKFTEKALGMGFENGLFPTAEDRSMEVERNKAKEFVKENYPDIIVAEVKTFKTIDEGIEFLSDSEEIWVLKSLGDEGETIVPESDDCEMAKEQLVAALTEMKSEYESHGYILEQKILEVTELTPEIYFYDGVPIATSIDIENKGIGAGNLGVQTGCFDRETEILTVNGWKKFEDLDIEKDTVANLDPENNKVIYSPILNYINYEYKGKMHRYGTKHVDALMTPNHRLWGKQKGSKKFTFVESQNLVCEISSPLVFPNVQESPERFIIENQNFEYAGKNGNGIVHKVMNGIDVLFTDWARFLGMWIAEGSLAMDRNGKISIITVSQTKEENMKSFSDAIHKIHDKWSYSSGGWSCGKSTLAEHLLEFSGKGTYDKRVPYYIKNASAEVIGAFLEGFILGDGSVNKKTGQITLFTVNKLLADDLMELCIKSGRWASIRERQPREWHIRGKSGMSRKQYEISMFRTDTNKSLNNVRFIKKSMKEVDFNDEVFCVSTVTGIILVRRNGKASWIGNCLQNLIVKTEMEDQINRIAFPEIVHKMAKEKKGLFVWDLSILIDSRGRMFFGEYCSNRLGWDAFPTELAMCGDDDCNRLVTPFFAAVIHGKNPFRKRFGCGVRILNIGRGAKVIEDGNITLSDEAKHSTFLYDAKIGRDKKLASVGYGFDFAVTVSACDDLYECVDKCYEDIEGIVFEGKYFRPKFDFMSYDYHTAILKRYYYALENRLISDGSEGDGSKEGLSASRK